MKKEKKRKLTIEQLEKRANIANKISNYFVIVAIFAIVVLSTISIITGITVPEYVAMKIISLTVIGIMTIYAIILKFAKRYEDQIKVRSKENKIYQLTINEDKVILKDESLKNAILSNSIDKVVFREIKNDAVIPKDADCTIELYLKDGSCMQTFFSMEEFLKLLNSGSKNRMLNHLIKSIQIENSEVEINAENFSYKEKVTDDELIEMFELKE